MMDAIEAIVTRHSVPKVRPDPVSRELIEQLLSGAVQAPNHFRVRPWRFFVVRGDARGRLGDAMVRGLKIRHPETTEPALVAERAKPFRAPVIIVVAVDLPSEPKVIEFENILSTAAAVENILIPANALGLGAMWRTGQAAYDPEVKAFFGLPLEQHLAAFVYVGYPDGELPVKERPGFEDRTVWME
jgi:nitroreductase